MKRNLSFTLLFSVIMVFCLSIQKLSAQWVSIGPAGGNIALLTTSDSSTMYACAGDFNSEFLYKSTDNGVTWSPITSTTWPTGHKQALGVYGNSLFIGTFEGIFRSDDNGLTWVNKRPGGGYCFAHNSTALFAGTDFGLLKSIDNGDTWIFSDFGLFGGISSIVATETDVYAGADMDGVIFHSADSGNTYAQYADFYYDVMSLGLIGNDLYAGCLYNGIYKLANSNGAWIQVYTDPALIIRGFRAIVGDSSVIIATSIAGVLRSTDGGANWTEISSNGIDLYVNRNSCPAVMTAAGIYVGTAGGIYRTENKGDTWSKSDAGIHANDIMYPSVVSVGADIYTGTYNGGVFRSSDVGQSWTDVSKGLSVNEEIVPPLFKMIGSDSTALYSDIFKSTDAGATWTTHNSPGKVGNMPWIKQNGVLITVNEIDGVYRSLDNGTTWTLSNTGISSIGQYYNLISDGTALILATSTLNSGTSGMYSSMDDGATWTRSIMTGGFPPMMNGKFLSTGTAILYGTLNPGWYEGQGIWRSADHGANWTMVLEHCSARGWAIGGKTIYVAGFTEDVTGSAWSSIYTSDNDGLNWSTAAAPDNMFATSIAAEGSHVFISWATLINNGILYSKDKCVTWTNVNYEGNYPQNRVNTYAFLNNKVYAGTVGSSLLVRNLDDFNEPSQPIAINGSAAACAGTTQIYSVTKVDGITYTWQVPASWVVTSGLTTNTITVTVGNTGGLVMVTPVNVWGAGSAQGLLVTVTAFPSNPVISQVGSFISSDATTGNQWYKDGVLIPGATAATYEVTENATYSCIVTINGCSSGPSNSLVYTTVGIANPSAIQVGIFPVPNDGLFTAILAGPSAEIFTLRVYNLIGSLVFEKKNVRGNGATNQTIDMRPVPSGIYTVTFTSGTSQVTRKMVINRK